MNGSVVYPRVVVQRALEKNAAAAVIFHNHPSQVAEPAEADRVITEKLATPLVAVSHSGRKDSQCVTILLSRLVPRDQLLFVHAPLGEVEWPGTI